jgi:hypothetical protein
MELTVACVKWGDKFDVSYVNKLYRAVEKNLTLPHRFVCLTDDPSWLDAGIAPYLFKHELEYCWNKLNVFDFTLKGTVLYFDLDVLITGNLDGLVKYKPEFNFVGIHDWLRDYTFNSSVFRFNASFPYTYVVTRFLRDVEEGRLVKKKEFDHYLNAHEKVVYWEDNKRYAGDQEWITDAVYPNGELHKYSWPESWCLSYRKHGRVENNTKVLVFHGEPKPHDIPNDPLVRHYW